MPAFRINKGKITILLCTLVMMYMVYTFASGWVSNQRVSAEQEAALQAVAELEARKAYLEGVRSYAASDAYVEQVARRELGYAREGEVPFVVQSPPLEENGEGDGSWWERLFPR